MYRHDAIEMSLNFNLSSLIDLDIKLIPEHYLQVCGVLSHHQCLSLIDIIIIQFS